LNQPKIYVGTAGWSYEDWVKIFYPFSQSREFSWLKYYSRYFNTVEVNSTYYTYLAPKIIEGWIRQIDNSDFLFTMKLHLDFTHRKVFGDNEIRLVRANLDILKESERLAGILIQFPYSFNFCEPNVSYLKNLIDMFDGYEKFIEVRHKSWENKTPKTVTFCSIDLPQIGEAIEFTPRVSNHVCYARFHGRNIDAWRKSLTSVHKTQTYEEQSERYNYLYSVGEIMEFDRKIKEIYDKAKKIYVIMNNHPKGNAIVNAVELMHFLNQRKKMQIPDNLKNSFPRLKTISKNEK